MRSELWELRADAGAPLLDLVQRIVSLTGIADALAASPRQDAAASMGNLRQFVSLVANFARSRGSLRWPSSSSTSMPPRMPRTPWSWR